LPRFFRLSGNGCVGGIKLPAEKVTGNAFFGKAAVETPTCHGWGLGFVSAAIGGVTCLHGMKKKNLIDQAITDADKKENLSAAMSLALFCKQLFRTQNEQAGVLKPARDRIH